MALNTQQQNLKVSYQFIDYIQKSNQVIMGHLYKFTSASGALDYFTDLDIDVPWDNVIWKSNSLRFTGMHRKISVGLQVDEQSVKIWAAPTDTLFGANFLTGAEEGLLDGALIVRYRIVWKLTTGNAAYDVVNSSPIAVWPLFTGYTSSIDSGGSTHIELKIKSPLVKLEVNMPRNYYQPGCLWNLFDAGCTLAASSFTLNKVIGPNPTLTYIPIVGGITAEGADGIPYYAQGQLTFTSGVNSSLISLINTNSNSGITLAYPLDALPSAGDTVAIRPGCSKSFATCQIKYGNSTNFRGFDKVPPVMMSM